MAPVPPLIITPPRALYRALAAQSVAAGAAQSPRPSRSLYSIHAYRRLKISGSGSGSSLVIQTVTGSEVLLSTTTLSSGT